MVRLPFRSVVRARVGRRLTIVESEADAVRRPVPSGAVWDDDEDDRPKKRGTHGASDGHGESDGEGLPKGLKNAGIKPVRVDLHVMSKCPFGVQVENTLAGVRETLGAMMAREPNQSPMRAAGWGSPSRTQASARVRSTPGALPSLPSRSIRTQ